MPFRFPVAAAVSIAAAALYGCGGVSWASSDDPEERGTRPERQRRNRSISRIAPWIVCFCLLGVTFAQAIGPAGSVTGCDAATETVEQLLSRFRLELRNRAEVGDGASTLSFGLLQDAAEHLSSELLAPYKEVLHCEARRLLADAHRYETIDLAALPLAHPDRQADLEALNERLTRSSIEILEEELGLFLFNNAWDPFQAVRLSRVWFLVGVFAESGGIHVLLDGIAPPELFVIDATANAPVIALVAGRELLIAHLEYVEERGSYFPRRLEWLQSTP